MAQKSIADKISVYNLITIGFLRGQASSRPDADLHSQLLP
jgi:hypothetical protein